MLSSIKIESSRQQLHFDNLPIIGMTLTFLSVVRWRRDPALDIRNFAQCSRDCFLIDFCLSASATLFSVNALAKSRQTQATQVSYCVGTKPQDQTLIASKLVNCAYIPGRNLIQARHFHLSSRFWSGRSIRSTLRSISKRNTLLRIGVPRRPRNFRVVSAFTFT